MSAKLMIDVAGRYVGHAKGDQAVNMLIDVYNTLKPLPRGWKAKYTDKYCAEFVTAIARMCQYSETFPNECGAMDMWTKCADMRIRIGDPVAGALIFFNYSHVGLVESVTADGVVHTIEGNVSGGLIERRTHRKTDPDILGYALPAYGDSAPSEYPFNGIIQTAVNVRSSPANLGAMNKVGLLKQSDPVTVIGDSGKWWRILYKEAVAYIVKNDGRIDIVKRT